MAGSSSNAQWGTSSYPPSPGTPQESYHEQDGDPSSTAASSVFLEGRIGSSSRPRRKQGDIAPGTSSRRFATQCATVDDPSSDMHDQHNASSVPIYMTATFKGSAGAGKYDCKVMPMHDTSLACHTSADPSYSLVCSLLDTRSGNPTRSFLGELSSYLVQSGYRTSADLALSSSRQNTISPRYQTQSTLSLCHLEWERWMSFYEV